MKSKIITWREFEINGDVCHITVHPYDDELGNVTAKWWRQSDKAEGELGYGICSCESAISQAENAILIQKTAEPSIFRRKRN